MTRRLDWVAPFRIRPVAACIDYSKSHHGKGAEYHEHFQTRPGRRLAWQYEQAFLTEIVQECGPIRAHLDFAGGTGRVAAALERFCQVQTVLDVSPSMLRIAQTHLSRARILCADFRTDPCIVEPGTMDMVTAFRFFPNAELDLRESAMRFIAESLTPGGCLICNNHRNFWSPTYVLGRVAFARAASEGMANGVLVAMAMRHGLRPWRIRSFGFVPQGETRAVLPWKWVERIEQFCWTKLSVRHPIGYDTLFAFRKVG
jgi:SAM-dependent methyltransferase